MPIDSRTPHSRRRLLAAAVGGAAAVATDKLLRPDVTSAVETPVNLDTDNPSAALTSITQGTVDIGAFKATANGAGTGLEGVSTTGAGVIGATGPDGLPAVVALQGDTTGSQWDSAHMPGIDPVLPFGAYGFSNVSIGGIGVMGESGSGTGLFGFGYDNGSAGVVAIGNIGAWIEGSTGAFIVSDANLNGLQVHVGIGSTAPLPPANTAIFASVSSNTQVGLEARGRIRFPNRSGRALIGAGKSSVVVYVSGMTTSNFAIATLNSSRTGRWVRAVVCATGRIAIYLNTTVASSTYVAWLVLG
jgi:hypothetical protein